MIKLEKKQVKIISVLIALVFIGSVVALALTQTGTVASAAGSSSVGVVDMNEVGRSHPELENFRTQMQAFQEEVDKDFEERIKGMSSDQEKQDYAKQCQQRVEQKYEELMEPIQKSMNDAIKKVADNKGIAVVVRKEVVVYGGQDITQDVIKAITKK